MAECDIGVLQLCWCTYEIVDIDLVNFGWDSKFGLTYGIQTGTERRLDHNLGFGRSWRRECQFGIAESVDDILDENMGKVERLCVDNLEL
ncbi:hypothetical protein NC651_014755 [Populus alba x Populus x berolinensis]|nr:hypothetical protein NC651_014755 [Populus alba x Populus x berolinensis]